MKKPRNPIHLALKTSTLRPLTLTLTKVTGAAVGTDSCLNTCTSIVP